MVCAGLATVLTAATGCGGSPSGPDKAAVAWEDQVCGAIGSQFTERALRKPEPNLDSQAAAQQAESAYLADVLTGLDGAITGVTQAGPAPVSGGDEVLHQVVGALGQLKTTISDAKTKIDQADPARPGAVSQALTVAANSVTVSSQTAAGVLKQIDNSYPTLAAAEQQAPNCHKFDNVTLPPTPSPAAPTDSSDSSSTPPVSASSSAVPSSTSRPARSPVAPTPTTTHKR